MLREKSFLFKLTLAGFIVISALGIGWISISWYFLSAAGDAVKIGNLSDQALIDMLQMRKAEKNFLLRDVLNADFFVEGSNSPSIQLHKKHLTDLQTQIAALQRLLPEEQRVEIDRLKQEVDVYTSDFNELVNSYRRLGLPAVEALPLSERVALAREIGASVESMEPVLNVTLRPYARDLARSSQRDLFIAQISILVIGVIAGGYFFHKLGSMLLRPLSVMAGNAEAIARGDLTQPDLVETSDEIGQLATAFNRMARSLRTLLSESKVLTGEVDAASGEIAVGAQQQLTSLNETASSLNEITATAEEFKATMQEFADRARAVQEAAVETSRRASEGRMLTQDSAARIEQVRTNSQSAGESVLDLSDQMQRIGEITATVNEVAEQTKLLALNASIEAARAGENGRGFAVVATQVRELANQSKQSAVRIESLISATQKSMEAVVSRIREGGRLSESSAEIVRRVSDAFEEIVEAIEQTTEAMKQINAGARQQEQGVTELVASISQIDAASKQSVAAAETTQNSILGIEQRIQALNASSSRFQL
ncbi:methyl-accepting chemotaxis protein [Lignipirellula cremea]|uniref:Methyl-accepting chemotaxis protein III n=1 Tax=Lignipirellula cremea TaxID=2528010 RepID=A0A518DSW0_9BACT|nr:HAMP domain-containing methyl-accepting chemotaxis protein [Lignipirellula cremea]QDU94925.1 Methyl-accepting chemotaxis protein III [Lignipirellula cremea]